jgi:ABC-2 type transport system permease protein
MQRTKKAQSLIQLALFAGIVIFLNILANARLGDRSLYGAIDLSEDKRFTLTQGSKNLLRNLDEVVYVKILLDGELPAPLKRLRSATQDMLDDFRARSTYIDYDFENPSQGSAQQANVRMENLRKEGIFPMTFTVVKKGNREDKTIYPFAVVNYKGRSMPVNLMENQIPGESDEVALNNAVSLLEYKLANAIQKLQQPAKPNVVFIDGHGELPGPEIADFERSLQQQQYNTGRLVLDSVLAIDAQISALVVAKPLRPFSEQDKFKIDQYIMNGGKVLWMLDMVRMDLDSLRRGPEYLPPPYELNLEDLLFRYGVRLQPNLVLDLQCTPIFVATGQQGSQQQQQPIPFPYHILGLASPAHPVSKAVGPVSLQFASSIDTIRTKTPVQKTIILHTSPRTRVQYLPVRMGLEFLRYIDEKKFDKGIMPLGVALEGEFSSMYENRLSENMAEGMQKLGLQYKSRSPRTRQIVIADGDVGHNKYLPARDQIVPLGYSQVENRFYANRALLLNAVEYLLDQNGIIAARGKNVQLRLLDTAKAQSEKGKWQLLNLGLPILLLLLFVFGYGRWRRWRYGRSL